FQWNSWFLFKWARIGLVAFADADRIDDNKVCFRLRVGRNGLEIGVGDDADAATFHLLEETAGFYRTHEHHDFERFDVGAGGDHIDSDGNARIRTIAESLNQLFRRSAGGAVGNLLAEVVSFIEFFAHDFYDVVSVRVVFSEDERLWNYGATGKDFGEKAVAKGSYHGADLIGRDDGAIKFV